jgi:hypothetical protein
LMLARKILMSSSQIKMECATLSASHGAWTRGES